MEEATRTSEYRVRLELSEKAEFTLREALAGERRREVAEGEREDLLRQLEALRKSRESSETAEVAPEGREPRPLREVLRGMHRGPGGEECSVARNSASGSHDRCRRILLWWRRDDPRTRITS
jgi:hypothetical protein